MYPGGHRVAPACDVAGGSTFPRRAIAGRGIGRGAARCWWLGARVRTAVARPRRTGCSRSAKVWSRRRGGRRHRRHWAPHRQMSRLGCVPFHSHAVRWRHAGGVRPVPADPLRDARAAGARRGDRAAAVSVRPGQRSNGLAVRLRRADRPRHPPRTRVAFQPDRYGDRWAPVLWSGRPLQSSRTSPGAWSVMPAVRPCRLRVARCLRDGESSSWTRPGSRSSCARIGGRRARRPCCCTSSVTWSGSIMSQTHARSCTPRGNPPSPTTPTATSPGSHASAAAPACLTCDGARPHVHRRRICSVVRRFVACSCGNAADRVRGRYFMITRRNSAVVRGSSRPTLCVEQRCSRRRGVESAS